MIPNSITLLFVAITVTTLFVLWNAFQKNKIVLAISLLWLTAQGILGCTEFYSVTNSMPPRVMLMIVPPILLILALFSFKRSRVALLNANIKLLTLLHTVRFPVELCLYMLYIRSLVPEMMTFEGRNFDIISGLTAPIIVVLALKAGKPKKTLLLLWNCIGIILLFNIVIHGILSAPTPFQQLNFDQPNVAVLYFPIVWLPSFLVPVVLLSHLTAFYQLFHARKNERAN